MKKIIKVNKNYGKCTMMEMVEDNFENVTIGTHKNCSKIYVLLENTIYKALVTQFNGLCIEIELREVTNKKITENLNFNKYENFI